MFYFNRGYQWKIDNNLNISGAILSASTLSSIEIKRRRKKRDLDNINSLLFDPQLYFPLEIRDNINKHLSYLGTYPWYHKTPPKFDSKEMKIKDYRETIIEDDFVDEIFLPIDDNKIKDRIKMCFDFQIKIGVDKLILPVPLVRDPENEYTTQLNWIKKGIKISKDYEKDCLVTVAIADNVLINRSVDINSLLQTIIDNLTALTNITGYYITIASSNTNIRITHKNIIKTILELSYILGHELGKEVILNYIDDLGFLGLAVGATSFGSGYYNKERRLNFTDYIDKDGGGGPLPHFYSFKLIGDFLPERDLSQIRSEKLFNYFYDDKTPFSESLFNYYVSNYKKGHIIKLPPDWEERINLITQAKLQRTFLLNKKTNELEKLDLKERVKFVLSWLQSAERDMLYLNKRVENPLDESGNHIESWRSAFESFADDNALI